MSVGKFFRVSVTTTLVVTVSMWWLPPALGFPPDISDPLYESLQEGDVNLGAIVSVHTNEGGRCTETTTMGLSAIEYLEAILYAVRQVNQDHVIPDVTLGVYVLDDCFSASLSLMRAIQFMPITGTDHAHSVSHAHKTIQGQTAYHSHSLGNAYSIDHAHFTNDSEPSPVELPKQSLLGEGSSHFLAKTTVKRSAAFPLSSSKPDTQNTTFSAILPNRDTDMQSNPTKSDQSNLIQESLKSSRQADVIPSDVAMLIKTDVSHQASPHPSSSITKSGNTLPFPNDVTRVNVTTAVQPDVTSVVNEARHPRGAPRFFEVAGVIGSFTSQHTIEVAKVLQLFQLPLISPSATSDVLSDKQRFPFFLRTLPPDRDQVKAMGQLLRHFNWTYVSMVYSQDPYGRGSQGRLAETLAALDVCVAQTLTLSATMTSEGYDVIIRSLRRHEQARVVLLYADVKHVQPLLEAVERNGARGKLVWVGSDSLFTVFQHNPHLCDVNLGSMAVKAHAATPTGFTRHMTDRIRQRSHALSHHSLEDWQMPADLLRLKATAGPDDADRSLDTHQVPLFGLAAFVVDAVYVYAHAVNTLLREHCPGARGVEARECVRQHSLHPYLQRVQFQGTSGHFEFDENGDVVGAIDVLQCKKAAGGGGGGESQKVKKEGEGQAASYYIVGSWEHRDATLTMRNASFPPDDVTQSGEHVPRSTCAEPCGVGHIYAFTRQTCCWSCVACKENEVTTANASGCVPCPLFHWPDQSHRRRCHDIVVPPTPTHPVAALALQIAAVLGLMLTVVTAFTFCLYRGQRVIRSSSRELSAVMLGGLTASYLLVFPLLATPTHATCYVTHVGFGLTFTLVYAPLLVKTHRIFRIFRAGRQSAALPACTSSASQLGITTALISVQVMIVTSSTAADPPSAHLHQPVLTAPYVERLCRLPVTGLGCSLAYHVLLVLLCTVLAFKTRRLPDNYNESRYIAFCVDTTLLVWIVFVPAYFSASVGAHKVVVMALIHLINSYVQLSCLFLPRLHALYRHMKKPQDAGNKLGSYGLISIKGAGSGAGLAGGGVAADGRRCVCNNLNSTPVLSTRDRFAGVNGDGRVVTLNSQMSVSDVMGSNTSSNGDADCSVVWDNKDDTKAVSDSADI